MASWPCYPWDNLVFESPLIPLLCEKAGVPCSDARGRITSHRARATIATLYYNCPDGLTGPEIQEFLGHASFHSTRSYIKANPTKLAKSVARANKNSRLVRVLVDPHAAVLGEPPFFTIWGTAPSVAIQRGLPVLIGWRASNVPCILASSWPSSFEPGMAL